MDIESTTDILTESHRCQAEAKSCGLTCTLICKATQTEKCWDEMKSSLRLKLCNANIHTCTSRFKEIQQKDNETVGAYVHHLKTVAKWCAFENDTVAIYIFVKGLRDAPTIASKIYEKDLQTLAEVIRCRLVEKLSAAHQLTATLTPSMVSMISSDSKCFVCGWTGHFGCHCPDVQCYSCGEFGHFAKDCVHRIPPSGTPCNHRRSCSGHQYTHNQMDRSHSYYAPRYRRHYSRLQSCAPLHHDRSCNFRRHASCSSSHCSSLHCPSADGCCHHDNNRHSCSPSHTCHFSCRHHTHHSWPQPLLLQQFLPHSTRFSAQEDKAMPNTLNPPNPTTPKLSPSRILLQTLHEILTVTLIL